MNLEEKILADIEKTGFAVELNIVSTLIENGWQVEHGSTYEDFDENKSREIDVVANKTVYIKELSLRLSFYLIIEAKKSSRPWVVFTTLRRYGTLGWSILHRSTNHRIWVDTEDGGRFRYTVFGMDAVSKNTPREHRFHVGKAFHELEKSPGEKSKIYEALIGSSKAAFYFSEKYRHESDEADFKKAEDTDVSIYLPVVILDGILYGVYNNHSGKIALQEQQFIPVELNYSSPKYRKHNLDAKFHPDLIRFDFLSDYLSEVEEWRKSMLHHLSEDLRKADKQPSKFPF